MMTMKIVIDQDINVHVVILVGRWVEIVTKMEDLGTTKTVKSELSIFDPLPYQVSHIKGDWIKHEPENQCYGTNTATPIIIKFDRTPGLYLDLKNSFLDVVVCIESTEGGSLIETKKVAFVNFALHSIFKDVSFSINNTKVEGENQQYSHKSYIYALLNTSEESKKFQMQSAGWIGDHAGEFDVVTNKGYLARLKWLETRDLYLAGPLYLDVWMQGQYLTDQCNVILKFTRQPPEFYLQHFSATPIPNLKINIKRVHLWMRKVQVSPSVLMGHQTGLTSMNARINYNSHKIFTYFLEKGQLNYSNSDCCPGIYPKLILAMFVKTASYNGDLKTTPYNFRHCYVVSIGLKVNGQFTPSEPYTTDFDAGDVRREYMMMILGTGHAGFEVDNSGIYLGDFVAGNTIFTFNLSPDLYLSGHGEPARISNIGIDIRYKTAPTENHTLLLFCRYDTKIEMTQLGNVVLDPTQSAN